MRRCKTWRVVLPTGKIVAMPPVLVLHGKLDNVVPLAREKALCSATSDRRNKYNFVIVF